jgi:hypothetical protein
VDAKSNNAVSAEACCAKSNYEVVANFLCSSAFISKTNIILNSLVKHKLNVNFTNDFKFLLGYEKKIIFIYI